MNCVVTSLPAGQAEARRRFALDRGQWGIEIELHYDHDGTFDEDRCQVRTGAEPQALAAALRTQAGRPLIGVQLVLSGGLKW